MLVKSQVKYIQSLSQKKFRDNENVFVAEGPKIINELLHATNVKPVSIFAGKEWIAENETLIGQLSLKNVISGVSEKELERISFHTTPNDVLAVFKKPVHEETNIKDNVSLVLDGIQDPGNLGTIVRIADWFGMKTIICSEDTADVFNPKVIQSTMGSIGRVDVRYKNLKRFLADHSTVPVYAATLGGENVVEMDKIKNGLIIIGNESKGIGKDILQLAKHQITIPKKGKAESLNAAVAAGIILSHLL
ncbi:MAG: RNA methyltransferase [Bacteroidetes bacterium]|nr:RNA methyltransferase [Bacteroidota bacterium]